MSEYPKADLCVWAMDRPCLICGFQGVGYYKPTNGQDVAYCDGGIENPMAHCARFNAPKLATGRETRSLSERPGIPPGKRSRILRRDNYTCAMCHNPSDALSIGHLIPRTEGVKAGLTDIEIDHDDNLMAVCDKCNSGEGREPVTLRFAVNLLRARIEHARRNPQGQNSGPDTLFDQ